ncbi:MAG TPA: secondary thiamine-phosphate synthase enzyme YjbQ [Actinomycetota bacterium]|nr:secondary thiamine-phosphate synthase enzyme YjbQ [Actinomycetota bacterium]
MHVRSNLLTTRTTIVTVEAPQRLAFVDLTPELEALLAADGSEEGFVIAFSRHTTCALLINELEDGVQDDLRTRLDHLFPPSSYYAHDDLTIRTQNLQPGERANGHAHVAQMLMGGTSQTIPFAGGELLLGRWQRLLLVELDEPKPRELVFQVHG